MMKIRYALLLSVSCLGLGSLAHAGITPLEGLHLSSHTNTSEGVDYRTRLSNGVISLSFQDIRALVLHTTHHPHLCPQDKLLSDAAPASVIARRSLPDEAIQSTHPNPLYQEREYREQATASLPLIGKDRMSRSFQIPAQGARSAILSPITPQQNDRVKLRQLANVCFISDTGECSGNIFGGANSPDNSSGGTPGGSSSGGNNGNDDNPEWDLDNKVRCELEGYTLTSCPNLKVPVNHCPYDSSYFEKCACAPNLFECKKPYYGVGESCDGKYASCKLDNPRACKEDGYTQTGGCNDVQVINKKCPYDPVYFDKCVCRSDLVSCPSPLQGVSTACGGKYKSCKCPSSYKSCDCGKAPGATSCRTLDGRITYSSCKSCYTPPSSSSSGSFGGSSSGGSSSCPSIGGVHTSGPSCRNLMVTSMSALSSSCSAHNKETSTCASMSKTTCSLVKVGSGMGYCYDENHNNIGTEKWDSYGCSCTSETYEIIDVPGGCKKGNVTSRGSYCI